MQTERPYPAILIPDSETLTTLFPNVPIRIAHKRAHVYLLHFPDRRHYIGATTQPLPRRLQQHILGRGSRWAHAHSLLAGPPQLALSIATPTFLVALYLERRFHRSPWRFIHQCPLCGPNSND